MMTILPAVSALARKLRPSDFEGGAQSVEVVALETFEPRQQAVYLSGEIDRLVASPQGTTFAIEMERLTNGIDRHAETRIYKYKNAKIIDGVVYNGLDAEIISSQRRRPVVTRLSYAQSGMLCSNYVIQRYFGHFATEGLILEELARDLGQAPITIQKPKWLHEDEYRDCLNTKVLEVEAIHIDTLSVADDRGWNNYRKERLQRVRARLRATVSETEKFGYQKIFLSRGSTGVGRNLRNSRGFEDALSMRGFDVVHPEELTLADLAACLHNANVIVGVEGSAFAHAALLSPPGALMIAIMPADRLVTIFKTIAEAVEMRWGFVVAQRDRDGQLEVDLTRLLATAELG